MKTKFSYLRFLALFVLLATSCSDDDEAVEALDEYGDIRVVFTYESDLENADILLFSNSNPNTNKITYLNNETEYEVGPSVETLDNTMVHSIETTDSKGLVMIVEITSNPYEKTFQKYKLEYYFNDQLVATKSIEREVSGLTHTWSWDTQDGLVELTMVDIE